MEVKIGTLAQYEDRTRDEYLAETPGLSRAEYMRFYPRGNRVQEWLREIEIAIRTGYVLSRVELDALWRLEPGFAARTVHHDYPQAIPSGYLPPHVLTRNLAHEAEMRAARRRGREAAK